MGTTLNRLNQLQNHIEVKENYNQNKNKINSECFSCKDKIEGQYFFCTIHKLAFCKDCATNGGKMDNKYFDAPKGCNLKNPFPVLNSGRESQDICIMEKKQNGITS